MSLDVRLQDVHAKALTWRGLKNDIVLFGALWDFKPESLFSAFAYSISSNKYNSHELFLLKPHFISYPPTYAVNSNSNQFQPLPSSTTTTMPTA